MKAKNKNVKNFDNRVFIRRKFKAKPYRLLQVPIFITGNS